MTASPFIELQTNLRNNITQQMNQEILELKQKTIDEMVNYMKYGGAEMDCNKLIVKEGLAPFGRAQY